MDALSGFLILISHGNLTQAFAYRIPLLIPGNAVHEYIVCRLWMSYAYFLICTTASTLNLVLLTLERYAQVVHPLWHKQHIRPAVVKQSLLLPWILSVIYKLPVIVDFGVIRNDGRCYQEFAHEMLMVVYGVAILIVDFLMPLGVFIFSYWAILIGVRKLSRRIGDISGNNSSDKVNKRNAVERNTLKTMILVCCVFTVTTIVGQIAAFLFSFTGGLSLDDKNAFLVPTAFMLVGFLINPIIYIFHYKEFRSNLIQLCRCKEGTVKAQSG